VLLEVDSYLNMHGLATSHGQVLIPTAGSIEAIDNASGEFGCVDRRPVTGGGSKFMLHPLPRRYQIDWLVVQRSLSCGGVADFARLVWNLPSLLVDLFWSQWVDTDSGSAYGVLKWSKKLANQNGLHKAEQ
jgi:hypothetical protein